MDATPDYDVLIAGGGPVGAAAALALRGSGLRIGLIEARGPQAVLGDPRPIALSHGSRLILERLGLWEALKPATPIERIHVSQRGGFGRVELDAREAGLPALGYVVDYSRLALAFAGSLEADNACKLIRAHATSLESGPRCAVIRLDGGASGRVTARLLAVADGGALAATPVRIRDYRQAVVTGRVACAMPHRNVAYERFTPEGPLALLPMGDGMALVWTTTPERAQQLCELTEPAFLERLQDAFGGRLGRFSAAGARTSFPVFLKTVDRIAELRIVALGNAAQTLHPVAGQGLNLGLRDAWELATLVRDGEPHEIGMSAQLERYRSRRRLDRGGGIGFTDMLVRLFSNDIAFAKLARGLGLAALGAVPPAKDFVVRRMTFGARG
jgi:2-octaprenyl-6-methoxyphenol hydroxylase